MKALISESQGSLEHLTLTEADKPTPVPDEILVSVKASAINPADLKVALKSASAGFVHSTRTPIRLGYDFSGVIEEIGEAVSDLRTGDEVYGFLPYSSTTIQGSFTEYVTIKSASVAKKPAALSYIQSAVIPTAASTAFQSLIDIGKMREGHKVLINGASGGVGNFSVQLARYYQAEVWGTAGPESQEFIKTIGVQHPVDYNETRLEELNQKFDIIFDVVSNSSFGLCRKMLNKGGTYITLLPSFNFLTGVLRALFSSKHCRVCVVQSKMSTLSTLANLFENGALSVYIDSTYPLEQYREAFERFRKGGVKGKVGVIIND